MGASLRAESTDDDDAWDDADLVGNNDDKTMTSDDINKSCQTIVSLPANDVSFTIECSKNDGECSTNVVIKGDEAIQNLINKDRQLSKLRTEVQFLKTELNSKQATIDNLLELLKTNLDVTKEISRGITSQSPSVLDDYDDITLVSDSNRNSQLLLVEDWHFKNIILEEKFPMESSNDFSDSLNSRMTSSINSYDTDGFIDSLEVVNTIR